jgi:hypothetical protein
MITLLEKPKRFLLIINAGPACVPFARHIGPDVDVIAIQWHAESKVDVRNAILWREKNRTNRKLASVATLLPDNPPHEAILAVDDDLTPIGCTWSDMFKLGIAEGFDVWHPAVVRGSDMAFPHMFQVPGALCRSVSHIDLQAIGFSRRAFARWAPYFVAAGPGQWGLIEPWGVFGRVGVLDATPIFHPRTIGRSARSDVGERRAIEEKIAFEQSLGLPGTHPADTQFEVRETRWLRHSPIARAVGRGARTREVYVAPAVVDIATVASRRAMMLANTRLALARKR